jgi:predicted TIM-barrel fold metal-dependent hydrolase
MIRGIAAIDLMLGPAGPGESVGTLLREMDALGVERGLLAVAEDDPAGQQAVRAHPDRFIPSYSVDPNAGMEGTRALVRMHEEFGVRAATCVPSALVPQVPIDGKRFYPLYAKCVELDIPVFLNAGLAREPVASGVQHVELLDEVCWFFPELRVVLRHGGEPWTPLAVKLMLKWPNLFYSTSGMLPHQYPQAIVDYANTRGAEKILYAGPATGCGLERAFGELESVPLRDHVWTSFLRGNALRVLRIAD